MDSNTTKPTFYGWTDINTTIHASDLTIYDSRITSPVFYIKKLLADEGYSSLTYEAITDKGFPVAIMKHEDEPFSTSSAAKEREMLLELNHENIVKILASFKKDGSEYSVLEVAEITNLVIYLDVVSYPIPEEIVAKIAYQLMNALSYYHEKSIGHGDLYIGNISVGNDDVVKIINFASAQRFENPLRRKKKLPRMSRWNCSRYSMLR